jgi:GT2 family glycosyltransferase
MCIIIIAHNNAGTLRKALDLLVNSELANKIIILVDNNSVDDFRLIIRKFMAKGLFLSRNTGFAAGVNIGFKACISAESYFVLSNPDAIATRDWLRKLVEFMNENGDVGMAQSLLIKPNGEYDSAGGFINGLGYPIEFRPKVNYELLRRVKPYEVGYAKGAAVLIRREAYLQVGGFDNRFFFYYDETDLSYRMRKAGWRIYVVPSSLVFTLG